MQLVNWPQGMMYRFFCCAFALVLAWDTWGWSQDYAALPVARSIEAAVCRAIETVEPSVVAIAKVPSEKLPASFAPQVRPDPFAQPDVQQGARPGSDEFVPTEYGTGVIIDSHGLVLTAFHVLGEDPRLYDYYVTLHDRRTFQATVVGADPRADLAVLSIAADNLKPITFGDASKLRKGQFVIALGNPYAIARDGQASASWGIVANLQRKLPHNRTVFGPSTQTIHQFGTLIQTDAKLNLGTSGGPLVDLQGQMVGLIVAWAAIAGYEEAAGYAYPVDEFFRRAVDTLKQGRELEYGLLGVTPVNLSPEETAKGLHGAKVERVLPGSPAEKFGLAVGDIVLSIDGKAILDADNLILTVGRMPVGATISIEILRAGVKQQLRVPLTKYPVAGTRVITAPRPNWRGILVDYISAYRPPEQQAVLGLVEYDAGVVVTNVERESPGWHAGLRPGMVISHVNGIVVRTPDQFYAVAARASGKVTLQVIDVRNDSVQNIVVSAGT